jgi:hypothetical protein
MSLKSQFERTAADRVEGDFPFTDSPTSPFYPPVCLRSHWDPTQMLRHIVPQQKVGLPLDFRPYVKVCLEYTTSGPAERPPEPPASMVFPPGGEFYPPSRYSAAIDEESALRRLDRPLRIPEQDQYLPPADSDMYTRGKMAPARTLPKSYMVQELSVPKALLRAGPYDCRAAQDERAMALDKKPFNNATKLNKYGRS